MATAFCAFEGFEWHVTHNANIINFNTTGNWHLLPAYAPCRISFVASDFSAVVKYVNDFYIDFLHSTKPTGP